MAAAKPGPGDQIGSYDLLEEVGAGSMGAVFKARHRFTQETLAIKIMFAEVAANPTLLKRFEQEFRIARQLDHPNIIRVHEFVGIGSLPYLVMELVEGESLGAKLEREGRMVEQEAVRLIVQIAEGLHQ